MYMGRFRNSLQYNNVGLFLTDEPAHRPRTRRGGTPGILYFVNRVQSASVNIDIPRQDIQQIGSEDFLDRKIVSEANITLNFDYLLTNGYEESTLGFNIAIGSGEMPDKTIYQNLREDKNAFLVFGEEQFDLMESAKKPHGYSGMDAMGIGNCYITNYTAKAEVGGFAQASVAMVASNVRYSCVGSGGGDGTTWLDRIFNLGYLLYEFSDELNSPEIYLEDAFEDVDWDGDPKLETELSNAKRYRQGIPFPSFNLANGATDPVSDDIVYTTLDDLGHEVTKIVPGASLPTGLELGPPIYLKNRQNDPFTAGETVTNPVIYKSPVSAIAPGGINLSVKNINVGGPLLSGFGQGQCIKGVANIQSFSLSIPFAREDLKGLGSMYVYGRKMKYPQIATLSLSLLTSAFESGNFRDIFCDDEIYHIEINLNNQCNITCNPTSEKKNQIQYVINNAKLQGYSFSEAVGTRGTVDCSFTFAASRNNGLFLSGSYECGGRFVDQDGSYFMLSEGGTKILEQDGCPVV